MTAAVDTMAYAGETPWHGLGFKVSNDLTPKQMLKAAKVDWTVSKVPVYMKAGGKYIELPGEFALQRDDNNTKLTMVGKTWKHIQNEEAFDFFTQFVKEAKLTMETAGSLWDGRYVWALAKLDKTFALSKGKDEVRSYLLLMNPHVFGKSFVSMYTSVCVVCWNTLCAALGSNLKGDASAFRLPHSSAFNEVTKKAAAVALGLAVKQAEEFKDAAEFLAKKKATEGQVEEFFCEILHFDPKSKDNTMKKDGTPREPVKLPHLRAALTHAPGQELPSRAGTWWGAVNAVTYVADHESGRNRDSALKNSWVGAMSQLKRDALELALKKAS